MTPVPFLCRAAGYTPLDPPGRLGDLSVTSVERIEETARGVAVLVKGEKAGSPCRVEILFVAPWAYCVSSESTRIRAAAQITSLMGPASLLHVVEGSEWLERWREEGGVVITEPGMRHFLVVTGDDWVDVITSRDPEVRWIEGGP